MKPPSSQKDEACHQGVLQPPLKPDQLLAYLCSLRDQTTTRSSYVTEYSLHFMPTFKTSTAGSISSAERANLMAPQLLDRGPSISDLDISRRTKSIEGGGISPSRRITVFSKSEVFGKYIKHRPRESKILPNASSISRISRNFENSHLDILPQHSPKSISPVHTIEDGDAKYTQGTPAPFEFAESRENTVGEKQSSDFSQILKSKQKVGEELKRRLTEFQEQQGKQDQSSRPQSRAEVPLFTDQASQLNIAQHDVRRSGRKLFRSLLSYSRPQSSQNYLYESISVQNIALDESQENTETVEQLPRQVKKQDIKMAQRLKTEESVPLPLHEVEEEPRTRVELQQEQRRQSEAELTTNVIQIQRWFRDFQKKKQKLRSLHDHRVEKQYESVPSNQRTPPKPTFYELEVIKKKKEWKLDKPTHHIKMMMMPDPEDQFRSLSPTALLSDPSLASKLLIKRDRSHLPDLTSHSRWIASSEIKQPRRSSVGGRVVQNTFYPPQLSVVAKLNRCGKSMPTLQDKRFKPGGVRGSLVLSPNVVASGPLIAPNKRDFKAQTHYPFRKKVMLKNSITQAAKEVKKVYVEQAPVLKQRSTASTRPSHSSYRSALNTKVLSDHYGMRSDNFSNINYPQQPSTSSHSRFAKTRSQIMPLSFPYPNNSRAFASDSSSLGGKRTCYSDDPLRVNKAYNGGGGLPSININTQSELKERMDKYSSLAFPQLNVDQGFSCLYKYKPQI